MKPEYKDYKLTNEQLIKALDHCTNTSIGLCADECPFKGANCANQLLWNAARRIELLNAKCYQQSATIANHEENSRNMCKEINSLNEKIVEMDGIIMSAVETEDKLRKENEDLAKDLAKAHISNRQLSETVHRLQAEIVGVKSEMESEMEQRCDECRVPEGACDPESFDLMEIVDDIINTCYSLVLNRRIRPAVLFRYVEDVIHDRERRRLRDEEEDE